MLRKLLVAGGTASFVLLLDRLGKHLALTRLAPGERSPLVGDWLSLAHTESTGAALGLLRVEGSPMQALVFALLSVVCVVIAVSFLSALTPREHGSVAALGAIVAGVLSNAFDRIGSGVGLDFLHLGPSGSSTIPDFNVADVAIVLGVLTLIVELLANELATRAQERTRR